MDKSIFSKMEPTQKAKIAVGYLISHKEDRPEGMDNLFNKLEQYEFSMREIMKAMDEARKSLKELQVKGDQMFGSVESVAELIAEGLPEDKIDGWLESYTPPTEMPNGRQMRQRPKPDMAGSTAGARPVEVPPEFKK